MFCFLKKVIFLVIVLCQLCCNTLYASSVSNIPTVTFLVKKYYDKELELHNAIKQKNTKLIRSFLADDFEERQNTNPNSPIPRDSWIPLAIKKTTANIVIEQMAVRELGNIMIVSYLKNYEGSKDSSFIVDIWRQEKESSILMARYSANSSSVVKSPERRE